MESLLKSFTRQPVFQDFARTLDKPFMGSIQTSNSFSKILVLNSKPKLQNIRIGSLSNSLTSRLHNSNKLRQKNQYGLHAYGLTSAVPSFSTGRVNDKDDINTPKDNHLKTPQQTDSLKEPQPQESKSVPDEHQIGGAMLSSQGRATNPSPYKDNITSSGSNLRNDSGTRPAVKRGRARLENAREQKVPSSSISRAFGFAGLGINLAATAVGGSVKNAFASEKTTFADRLVSDSTADKITQTLCKMRGVPLKLGQALSMQEEELVPKVIREAMARAQQSADIMPQSQLNQMLEGELGRNWREYFEEFEERPIAAASIGQVHKARTKEGIDVAVKVQYPGVADSVDSDFNNLKRLFGYTNILPKSFFVGDLIKNLREELKEECDYILEANKQMEIRELFKGYPNFIVPKVISHLSTKHVLTTEWVDGLSIEECIQTLDQAQKDRLGHQLITLCYNQLFEARYMQTDPNPANYFYDPEKDLLYLIDYGAAKKYPKPFVASYMDMLQGSIKENREAIIESSKRLGVLTGDESRDMLDTHVAAVVLVGEPFRRPGLFDFGNQNLTKKIYEKMPEILHKRLKAPSQDVFSLHRILGGTFLMCMKLKSVVDVQKLFDEVYRRVADDLYGP